MNNLEVLKTVFKYKDFSPLGNIPINVNKTILKLKDIIAINDTIITYKKDIEIKKISMDNVKLHRDFFIFIELLKPKRIKQGYTNVMVYKDTFVTEKVVTSTLCNLKDYLDLDAIDWYKEGYVRGTTADIINILKVMYNVSDIQLSCKTDSNKYKLIGSSNGLYCIRKDIEGSKEINSGIDMLNRYFKVVNQGVQCYPIGETDYLFKLDSEITL